MQQNQTRKLRVYNTKRKFGKTPEPIGGQPTANQLSFVIQKHAATQLHYDFRLEMKGVLKSWAVPKGPSLNPATKHLAMQVEDHPYDYKDFEGVIPKGNYGAGTVIVWDQGYYEPVDSTGDKQKDERKLLQALKAGSIKIKLFGKKLKGEFALVKMKNTASNAWLLIKHRDEYATEKDITTRDKSVISKKNLAQIAKSGGDEQNKDSSVKPGITPKQVKTAPQKKKATVKEGKILKQGSHASILSKQNNLALFSPMLATLVKNPMTDPGWEFEIKWDGYRTIAICENETVHLLSRNKQSFNEQFEPVQKALSKIKLNAVLDGEICVSDKSGKTSFAALQNWKSPKDGLLQYYVFDLLMLDQDLLLDLPLEKRRNKLNALVPDDEVIKFSASFDATATEFLEAAQRLGIEGIMAKRLDSPYLPGTRTTLWKKLKVSQSKQVYIAGFTKKRASKEPFSALLAGEFKAGKLHYIGRIGTGFTHAQKKQLLQRFKPLIRKTSAFSNNPDILKYNRYRGNEAGTVVSWLKPTITCRVSYSELTKDGLMRHPSFEGLSEDLQASAPMLKVASKISESSKKSISTPSETALQKKINNTTTSKPVELQQRKIKPDPAKKSSASKSTSARNRAVAPTIPLTNLHKLYWPKERITKGDMLHYYQNMAPYLLPYLKNRPQSLNRFPNGITGKSFYQKNVTDKVPDWIEQYPYKTDDGVQKHFMVVQNENDILYMANLGVIEMNPWNSTINHPDNPTWCLLDLDPGTKSTFRHVVETALMAKSILDDWKVTAYAKTSGSTGIHIYIPLAAKYDYNTSQLFAKLLAAKVQEQLPKLTSIERTVSRRMGKLYIDYLQNRAKATLAAAYSLRPKPKATVSMPLHWDEVNARLKMTDFTIHNALDRVKAIGDIFKPVLGKGVQINQVLKTIQSP